MKIRGYPENREQFTLDLSLYLEDRLKDRFYWGSGQIEGIRDVLDNLIVTISNLLVVLVEKKKIDLSDLKTIVKDLDYYIEEDSQ